MGDHDTTPEHKEELRKELEALQRFRLAVQKAAITDTAAKQKK
jgi:hypothetical protein